MGVRTANVQPGNIGETLTGLAEVIRGRRDASLEESYTARLLTDVEDELLKKLAEEASEVIMACKDNDHDHIRYEAGDLIYHLLVTLERYGITLDELAGELTPAATSRLRTSLTASLRRGAWIPIRRWGGGYRRFGSRSRRRGSGPRGYSSRCRRRGVRPSQK